MNVEVFYFPDLFINQKFLNKLKLTLNNQQWLIFHKTKQNQFSEMFKYLLLLSIFLISLFNNYIYSVSQWVYFLPLFATVINLFKLLSVYSSSLCVNASPIYQCYLDFYFFLFLLYIICPHYLSDGQCRTSPLIFSFLFWRVKEDSEESYIKYQPESAFLIYTTLNHQVLTRPFSCKVLFPAVSLFF